MQIDRKRFLSLVSAIGAVAACGGAQHEEHAVIVAMDPVDAGAATIVEKPAVSVEKPAEPPKPKDGLAEASGIWLGTYDPKAKARTCADLKCPTPTQEGMGALRSACRSVANTLNVETYQRFMTCMMKMNNTSDTCDLRKTGTDDGECLDGWYTTQTIDAATEAKCRPIVSACSGPKRDPNADGTLKMSQCQQMLSVTSSKSEKKMIHCITEYCEGALKLCHGSYG